MRRHFFLLAVMGLSLGLFFFADSPFAATLPIKNFDRPRLIESGELSAVIGHRSVRIVDMRSSLIDYLRGHVPQAVFLNVESLEVPNNGVPAQALSRICLERLLGENLGASNDMWIIIYSEQSNPNATYLAWILDFLGHRRVGILNGGWEKWVSEGHAVTQAYPFIKPKKFFGKAIVQVVAEKNWLSKRMGSKGLVIVDARSPKEYSGEEGAEMRKGHIPGARNVFWEGTIKGGDVRTWKSPEELRPILENAGIAGENEIVIYSRTGREASHLYFTLKHVLGYPRVRLYRGSWVEWVADTNMPVKSGRQP